MCVCACVVYVDSQRRPWCLIELFTAVQNSIPLVAINVAGAHPYNFEEATKFLENLDTKLELANPGAAAEVERHCSVDMEYVACQLSQVIPQVISVSFNPSGSARQLEASVLDLIESIEMAAFIAPELSREEWLAQRQSRAAAKRRARRQTPARSSDSEEMVPMGVPLAPLDMAPAMGLRVV